MPLYEYKCDLCGGVFEVIQKFSDPPLRRHEGCGGSVERLLSPPAIQFKGTGWYVTDYARGANGKGAKPHAGDTADKPGANGAAKTGPSKASTSGSSATETKGEKK